MTNRQEEECLMLRMKLKINERGAAVRNISDFITSERRKTRRGTSTSLFLLSIYTLHSVFA